MMLVPLSSISPDPYPANIDPYPKDGSHSARLGLQVFDLITPDGHRVWVVAGWKDNGQVLCWTVQDFVKDRRPSKIRIDETRYFAPLSRINACSDLREQFITDYMALHHQVGEQFWRLGCDLSSDSFDWIGKKVIPYGPGTTEHVVRDVDQFYRFLIVDSVRAQNPRDYEAVDGWEVTASWHCYDGGLGRKTQSWTSTESSQYLYRLFNHADELLYIGVTDNVFRRWKEHSKDKPWWYEVYKFTQETYPDRASVEAAERNAIKVEQPLYNVTHAARNTRSSHG